MNTKIFDLNELKSDRFLAYLFLVLALTMPGIGIILKSNSNEILKFEISSIVPSVYYSVPIFLMGFFIAMSSSLPIKNKSEKEKEMFKLIFLGSFTSLILYYASTLIYYVLTIVKFNYLTSIYIYSATLSVVLYIKMKLEK